MGQKSSKQSTPEQESSCANCRDSLSGLCNECDCKDRRMSASSQSQRTPIIDIPQCDSLSDSESTASSCDDIFHSTFTQQTSISSNRKINSCICRECSLNKLQSPDYVTGINDCKILGTAAEKEYGSQSSKRHGYISTSFDESSNYFESPYNKSNDCTEPTSPMTVNQIHLLSSDSRNCSEADSSSCKMPSSHMNVENQPIPEHLHLIKSIMYGDEKQAIRKVKHFDGCIDNTNSAGITPLIAALIRRRSKELVEALLDKGAQTDVVSSDKGWTPLMYAVDSCPLDIVELLVRRDSRLTRKTTTLLNNLAACKTVTDVDEHEITDSAQSGRAVINVETAVNNICTNNGSTALMLAVEKGRIDVVKLLIDSRADMNLTGKYGSTALMLAAERGCCDIVKIFINRGADVNIVRTTDGNTALMLAAEKGSYNSVQMLVDAGANVNIRRITDGGTALILVSERGRGDIVKTLIDSKADLNVVRTTDGCTALMIATEKGRCDIVQMLINAGADLNSVNTKDGSTALMVAINASEYDVVKQLIDAGADVNSVRTEDECTALMIAVKRGSPDILKLLLESGADVLYARKTDGSTALILAAEQLWSDVIVKLLLDFGANINANRTSDGRTPLMLAVLTYLDNVTKLLLDSGADLDITSADGSTALMLAIEHSNRDVMLIDAGADTNIKRTDGSTVLMLTIENPSLECTFVDNLIDVLIYARVDLNAARNTDGSTALMLAIEKGRFKTAKKLILAGVDINITRKSDGSNALALALEGGPQDLVEKLKEYRLTACTSLHEKCPTKCKQLRDSGYQTLSSSLDDSTASRSSVKRGLESADLPEIKSCIEEKEYNDIIEAADIFSKQPDATITIANILVEKNSVTVRYLMKCINNETVTQQSADGQCQRAEESSFDAVSQGTDHTTQSGVRAAQNEAAVSRDLDNLRNRFKEIAPEAEIKMTKLKKMPWFKKTAGLSSRLIHVDNGIRNRIGQITALLHDSCIGDPAPTDYALTAGHNVSLEDKVFISCGNYLQEIGTVIAKIEDNGGNGEYVDAALIKLHDKTIEELELTQRFSIDEYSYRLSQTELELPQQGRVVLRAVDQTRTDDNGFISHVGLNIYADQYGHTRKYSLVQVTRYSADGNHRGNIHTEGDSGLLTTYEPSPDTGDIVKPVIMLIGLYPHIDEHGNEIYNTSVGVDLRRVLARMSTAIDKNLQLFQGT